MAVRRKLARIHTHKRKVWSFMSASGEDARRIPTDQRPKPCVREIFRLSVRPARCSLISRFRRSIRHFLLDFPPADSLAMEHQRHLPVSVEIRIPFRSLRHLMLCRPLGRPVSAHLNVVKRHLLFRHCIPASSPERFQPTPSSAHIAMIPGVSIFKCSSTNFLLNASISPGAPPAKSPAFMPSPADREAELPRPWRLF